MTVIRFLLNRYWGTTLLVLSAVVSTSAQEAGSRINRYMPGRDLVFYFEFDGFKAHAQEWNKTDFYQILNKTPMRQLVDDLSGQVQKLIENGFADAPDPQLAKFMTASIGSSILHNGFGMSVHWKPSDRDPRVVFVQPGMLKDPKLRAELQASTDKDVQNGKAKVEKKGSRQVIRPSGTNDFIIMMDGDDLVFVKSDVAADLNSSESTAGSLPRIQALSKPLKTFKPALRALLDISAIPMPPQARQLGLDGLKQVEVRFGFDGNQLRSELKVAAPAPRQGLLALLDIPALDKTALATVPADATSFTAFSFDPGGIFTKAVKMAGTMQPGMEAQMEQFQDQFRQNVGVDLKKYVLDLIGPAVVFGTKKAATPNAPDEMFVSMEVRNPQALVLAIDKLAPLVAAIANQAIAQQGIQVQGPVEIVRQKSGTSSRNWVVKLPKGLGMEKLTPMFRIGEKTLVFAFNAKTVSDVLATAEGRGKPFEFKGKFAALAPNVPARLAMIQVRDDSQTVPATLAAMPAILDSLSAQMAAAGQNQPLPIKINPKFIPTAQQMQPYLKPAIVSAVVGKEGLTVESHESVPTISAPAAGGIVAALLLPAVQSAREAARRAQCMNNCKQIGLAMLNHEAAYRAFPKQAITDKDGKPLLSWRVAILPFMEQEALYKQFRLDEPWDSPHNKALISQMPKAFACPSHDLPPGMTNYRVPAGTGTIFEPGKATAFKDILDGTSNTLMLVESTEPVEWTKPEDIDYRPADPTAMLGSRHAGGYNAMFADGSVRFIAARINREMLKALFSKAGGEVVNP